MPLSNAAAPMARQSFRFMDLTLELRQMIYVEFLRSQPATINFSFYNGPDVLGLGIRNAQSYQRQHYSNIHPATDLLLVNRQMNAECDLFLYNHTLFEFVWYFDMSDLPLSDCVYFYLSRRVASRFRHSRLKCDGNLFDEMILDRLAEIFGMNPRILEICVMVDDCNPQDINEVLANIRRLIRRDHPYEGHFDLQFCPGGRYYPRLRILLDNKKRVTVKMRNEIYEEGSLLAVILHDLRLRREEITVTRERHTIEE